MHIEPDTRGDAIRLRRIWDRYRTAHPDVTQETFAASMGLTQGMFSHWLSGRKPVSLGNLLPLAKKKLQVRPEEISPGSIALLRQQAAEAALDRLPSSDKADLILSDSERILIERIRSLSLKEGRDFSASLLQILETLAPAPPANRRKR